MIPFSVFALIAVVGAFIAGFFTGKGQNQQNAGRSAGLAAPEELKELGEKGRATVQKQIQKRKDRIVESASLSGRITNDDVEDLFCISDSTARSYLDDLEDEGFLVQHGENGRGVFYTPTK